MMDTIARSRIRELKVVIDKNASLIEMASLRINDLQHELSTANWLIRVLCENHDMGGESLADIKDRLVEKITEGL